MFLYTIGGQHSNLVCFHNNTLACSISSLIISSVSGIVTVMYLVVPATPSFLILHSVEAIVVAHWTQ